MILDLIVIGSGGAGLSAAIEAKKAGANVTVVSKNTITSAQTSQAQGGINAVMSTSNDTINNHIEDTLKSAHDMGDKQNIQYMCENAKETINWLDNIAVAFSKDKNNNIAQRKLGGTSFNRACYSSDYTGLKILHTLFDTALKENITFLEDYMLLNIIKENNTAIGVTLLNITTSQVEQILAKKIILATGGYGGIFSNYNTNSSSSTGDGIIAAFNAKCELTNMEFVQFHPTALKNSCILISESARGEGGYLVTKDGNRFVDELLPRDIVAREIYTKIQNKEDVFLDLRHLGYDKIINSMPQEYNLALKFLNLKMDKDLIPIIPAAHYSMGGIKTNIYGETSISNLYAIGECANNGVHGANRLGGNSLLDIILFGRKTGKHCIQNIENIDIVNKKYQIFIDDTNMIQNIFKKENNTSFYKIKEALGELLYLNVGLFRNEKDLLLVEQYINKCEQDIPNIGIGDKNTVFNTNLKEYLEFINILTLAKIVTTSASFRKESRGAHYRIDYPKAEKQYNKPTIVIKNNANIMVKIDE